MTKTVTKKGFTLIEMVVVVAIIGLLTATVTLSLGKQRTRTRDARRIADVSQISSAIDSYYAINSAYIKSPAPAGGCDPLTGCVIDLYLTPLIDGGLLKSMPKDPLPASTGGVNSRCYNYTYKSDTPSVEYLVGFGAEMPGVSGKHPLNANIITGSLSGCSPNSRGEAYIVGPKRQP